MGEFFKLAERFIQAMELIAHALHRIAVKDEEVIHKLSVSKDGSNPSAEERARVIAELERLGKKVRPRTQYETLVRELMVAKVEAGELPPDPTAEYRKRLAAEQDERVRRQELIDGRSAEVAGKVPGAAEELGLPGKPAEEAAPPEEPAAGDAAPPPEKGKKEKPPKTPKEEKVPKPSEEPARLPSETEVRAHLNNFFQVYGVAAAYRVLEEVGGPGCRKFSVIKATQYVELMKAMAAYAEKHPNKALEKTDG